MSNEIEKASDSKTVEYVPFGASDAIRLSVGVVQSLVAVPTRSGKLPTERDCVRFMLLCRGKRANPFEGDCFMIGYDTQDGPQFSLVCGVELFLKRAEASPDYDGRESGVIVERDGDVLEVQGSFMRSGDTLLGGWAKAFRKDRARPEHKSVRLEVYNTGRSRWAKDPGGMIEKVALSQALRSAFPTALGGMYTIEEMDQAHDGREPIEMPQALVESAETTTGNQAAPKESPAPAPKPEGAEGDLISRLLEQKGKVWVDAHVRAMREAIAKRQGDSVDEAKLLPRHWAAIESHLPENCHVCQALLKPAGSAEESQTTLTDRYEELADWAAERAQDAAFQNKYVEVRNLLGLRIGLTQLLNMEDGEVDGRFVGLLEAVKQEIERG